MSWLTVFKAVPWPQVLQAAPAIVQGARALLGGEERQGESAPVEDLQQRLERLESEIAELDTQQTETAKLVAALAQQNEALIAAVEALRWRVHVALAACAVLGVTSVGLLIYML